MSEKQLIAIYKGRGVSAHSYRCLKQLLAQSFEVIAINPAQINNGDLSNQFVAIVFPGGADVPYDRALIDVGIKYISTFVEKGGLYVGVCAGSYFASSAIDFTCFDGSVIKEPRRLEFFKGTVKGPAYGNYVEGSHASAQIVDLKIRSKIYKAYFNGGGNFIADLPFEKHEILATYAGSDLPAALQIKVGKGQAFLCAFHPEYNNHFLKQVIISKENGHQALELMLSKGGLSEYIESWFVTTIKECITPLPINPYGA